MLSALTIHFECMGQLKRKNEATTKDAVLANVHAILLIPLPLKHSILIPSKAAHPKLASNLFLKF